jgi:nucleotide-binding universal stress UspA family protein
MSTDFSKSCEHAFQFAIKFALKNGSKLFLFHMIPGPSVPEHSKAENEEEPNMLKKKLKSLCKEIPKGIDHEYCVSRGNQPHLEIQRYMDKNNIDLIVMGSHTKDNEGKWYIGSTVERVSNRSICPVVVITDPKALLSMDH